LLTRFEESTRLPLGCIRRCLAAWEAPDIWAAGYDTNITTGAPTWNPDIWAAGYDANATTGILAWDPDIWAAGYDANATTGTLAWDPEILHYMRSLKILQTFAREISLQTVNQKHAGRANYMLMFLSDIGK
jgi:hypothetical protein